MAYVMLPEVEAEIDAALNAEADAWLKAAVAELPKSAQIELAIKEQEGKTKQQREDVRKIREQERQERLEKKRRAAEEAKQQDVALSSAVDSLRASQEQLAKELRARPAMPDSTAPLLVKISELLAELLARQPPQIGATTQKIHADAAGDVDRVETFGADGKLLKTQRIKREDGRISEVETIPER